jgi:hypothetical protein
VKWRYRRLVVRVLAVGVVLIVVLTVVAIRKVFHYAADPTGDKETPEQLQRAYPMIGAFFAAKRQYDPAGIFTNTWYEKYAPMIGA